MVTIKQTYLKRRKTDYMIIGSRQRLNQIRTNPDIVMGDNKINKVSNKTFLGVILDEQLNWHDHINKQCTKISKSIALLRRAKNYMTENTLNTMYNALVLPHFIYCSTVWHNGNLKHIDKLKRLQKRASRVITSSGYETRSAETFKKLNWEPISSTVEQREQVMTYKAIHGLAQKYLTDMFTLCQNNKYALRSNGRKMNLPKPHTNFRKKSFSYRGAVAWNRLPCEITQHDLVSLNHFKRAIKFYQE